MACAPFRAINNSACNPQDIEESYLEGIASAVQPFKPWCILLAYAEKAAGVVHSHDCIAEKRICYLLLSYATELPMLVFEGFEATNALVPSHIGSTS